MEIDRDYPENRQDSDYCQHGQYIGSWAGPDFMCGFCEDGTSPEEYAEYMLHTMANSARLRIKNLVREAALDIARTLGPILGYESFGKWYMSIMSDIKMMDDRDAIFMEQQFLLDKTLQTRLERLNNRR